MTEQRTERRTLDSDDSGSSYVYVVVPMDWWTDYGWNDVMDDLVADGVTTGEAIPVRLIVEYPFDDGSLYQAEFEA